MLERFEKGESVLAVFCDLLKDFDCVSHQIPLNKLVYYGIRGNSLQIIKLYLSDHFLQTAGHKSFQISFKPLSLERFVVCSLRVTIF